MKKLMFAAFAAAAMSGFCVESDIVGYQKTTLKLQGYNFIVPTFEAIGDKQQYDLQDIKLIGAPGMMGEQIIVYDKDACLEGTTYVWLDESMMLGPTGWYDLANVMGGLVKNVQLPRGIGLYFNCPTPGVTVQFSGKVSAEAQTNDLIYAGYNMIGNSTPVQIDLQDIKLIGALGMMGEQIIVYDKNACLEGTTYVWLDESMMLGPTGWYDLANVMGGLVTGVKIEPGEGVYLNVGTQTGIRYSLPAAIK